MGSVPTRREGGDLPHSPAVLLQVSSMKSHGGRSQTFKLLTEFACTWSRPWAAGGSVGRLLEETSSGLSRRPCAETRAQSSRHPSEDSELKLGSKPS